MESEKRAPFLRCIAYQQLVQWTNFDLFSVEKKKDML